MNKWRPNSVNTLENNIYQLCCFNNDRNLEQNLYKKTNTLFTFFPEIKCGKVNVMGQIAKKVYIDCSNYTNNWDFPKHGTDS